MGEQDNPGDSISYVVPYSDSPVGAMLLVLCRTILVFRPWVRSAVRILFVTLFLDQGLQSHME